MKIAATIIDGVAVAAGANLQEQKSALKALAGRGQGNVKAFVLYSSQRPAMRKSIALEKDESPADAYKVGLKLAKAQDAKQAKIRAQAAKEQQAEVDRIKKMRKLSREIGECKDAKERKKLQAELAKLKA